jgi:hypothetical protein
MSLAGGDTPFTRVPQNSGLKKTLDLAVIRVAEQEFKEVADATI